MSKINVLIIENQKSQYIQICKYIKKYGDDKFDVLPQKEEISFPEDLGEYEEFMDNIRIALNTRNAKNRISKAKKNIITYFNTHDIDVIIMDHNLVGWHEADDGIDLAYYLAEKEEDGKNKIDIPILFLSRTPLNSERFELIPKYSDIKEKYETIKSVKTEWVEKGYAGGALLEESYFKRNVIKKIENLCNDDTKDMILEKFNSLLLQNPEITDSESESLITIKKVLTDNLSEIPKDKKKTIKSILEKDQPIKTTIKELRDETII